MRYLKSWRGPRPGNHGASVPATENELSALSKHGKSTFRSRGLVLRSKLRRQSLASCAHRRSQSGHIASQDAPKSRRSERVQVWMTVVTALTAIFALALSVFTYIQLNYRAPIQMTMPRVMRISQGVTTNVYIQPIFTVQRKTDIAEVVTSAKVMLRGPTGTNVTDFYWWGTFGLNGVPNNFNVNIQYISDPTPIIVTEESPQHPVLDFFTTHPAFTVGRWKGSLIAEQQGQAPLVAPFCIDISTTDVLRMEQPDNKWFYFRNDQPSDAQAPDSSCYVWGR
jgi:hypothetical protein